MERAEEERRGEDEEGVREQPRGARDGAQGGEGHEERGAREEREVVAACHERSPLDLVVGERERARAAHGLDSSGPSWTLTMLWMREAKVNEVIGSSALRVA